MIVVKIGGNIIDDELALSRFLKDFSSINDSKILIHGGGKIATQISKEMGLVPKMVEGRRITDADTLKIVTMVYAGLINKNIVAQLQKFNCNAIGLSGADANVMQANKRVHPTIDFGYIGHIQQVNTFSLNVLLNNGMTPIIAPITYDGDGGLLNTNADDIASKIAIAMSKESDITFVYCFEKKGLLLDVEDENSYLPKVNSNEIQKLKDDGIITDGMIPKVDNIKQTLVHGVKKVILCHASDIIKIINENAEIGTIFTL
jgi:acetylglutamate kinase